MTQELNKLIDETTSALQSWTKDIEVITMITEILRSLSGDKISDLTGDDLSRAATRLSILLSSLSPYIERTKMAYNMTYSFRKFKSASLYNGIEKMSQGDKKMKVEEDMRAVAKAEVFENYRAETLNRLYRDVDRIISVIQSRLKYMLSEARNQV